MSRCLSLSSKEQAILQEVCESRDADSYVLTWPVGCPGTLKLKMVARYGEEGAALYHKVMDLVCGGSEEEEEGTCCSVWRDQCVTLKQTTDSMFTVEKRERKGAQGTSLVLTDWRQLTDESLCPRRTRTPPTHLYIRSHTRWEGWKWKTAKQDQTSRKKGKDHSKVLDYRKTIDRVCTCIWLQLQDAMLLIQLL